MIDLIVVPYDSGRRGFRMGRGPEHLLRCGLADRLAATGRAVRVVTLETAGSAEDTAFDLADQIARATDQAVRRGHYPVILAGNCIASIGGVAGTGTQDALLWLDAHADLNTPATSPSGFLDGMTLAIMTGRCHRERARAVRGFRPLRDDALVLLGVRAIDDSERESVDRLVTVMNAAQLRGALAHLEPGTLYLHVDLDVLDPSSLHANEFATAGGLSTESLVECISLATRMKHVTGLAVTAYDPATDPSNAALAIVCAIIECVTAARPSQSAVGTKPVRPDAADTLLD